MAETMNGLKRTSYCGKLSKANVGNSEVVCGWVQKQRDKGHLIFIDLRDRTGVVQLGCLAQHQHRQNGGKQRDQVGKKAAHRGAGAAHPRAPEAVGQNGGANGDEHQRRYQRPAQHQVKSPQAGFGGREQARPQHAKQHLGE